jgi:hypothetical protein
VSFIAARVCLYHFIMVSDKMRSIF